jgi:tRNA pseudouridine(38-40) synthase
MRDREVDAQVTSVRTRSRMLYEAVLRIIAVSNNVSATISSGRAGSCGAFGVTAANALQRCLLQVKMAEITKLPEKQIFCSPPIAELQSGRWFMHVHHALRATCILSSLLMISTFLRRMSSPIAFGRGVSARLGDAEAAHNSYKRKLAIVVSYVGSNYYGIQLQPTTGVPTIESELRRALYEIGAILPSNDFDRISWSRSSRTDKGVHASRIIVSGKFEVQPSWLPAVKGSPEEVQAWHTDYLQKDNVRIKGMVEALNNKLPADIRAMSCIKVNKSFAARDACVWREYEYILPAEILTHPIVHDPLALEATAHLSPVERYSGHDPATQTTAEGLDRLNAAFEQFLGTRMFQNFNNIKRKELDEIRDGSYKRKMNKKASKYARTAGALVGDADDAPASDDESAEGEEADVDQPVTSDTTGDAAAAGSEDAALAGGPRTWDWTNHHDDWTPVERIIVDKFRNRIYHMHAGLKKSPEGRDLLSITIRGSAFLLK